MGKPKRRDNDKIRVLKDLQSKPAFPWIVIMPTVNTARYNVTRYTNWNAAHDAAMMIQDGINRNWT